MVWDGALNVTNPVAEAVLQSDWRGAVFTKRVSAEHLADCWNAWCAA
jgi:hypothetical protein